MPASPRRLSIFLPFALGYFLSYLLRAINAVLAPDLTRDLGLSPADLGLLTATYFLSFAVAQLPLGLLLDRYGPRRVEAVLLGVAAAGCLAFALAQDLTGLALGRALIGLGVSACLMAALQACLLWFGPGQQAALTGQIMAAGALGALTATVPLEWLLPLIGWRGCFLVLATACAVMALVIGLKVPEAPRPARHETLAEALAGLRTVLSNPLLHRYAGNAACIIGGFMALQGLWVVPWLMSVEAMSRADAAGQLFALNLGMFCGQLGLGTMAPRLAAAGWEQSRLMRSGQALSALLILALLAGAGRQAPLWFAFGLVNACNAQVYSAAARHFSPRLAGRVATAVNLAAFVGAFALQWGFGALLEALNAAGLDPAAAFRWSLAGLLALQLLSTLGLPAAPQATAKPAP